MKIIEMRNLITQEQVNAVIPLFSEAFGRAPSENFLQRLHEKTDLSFLLAYEEDTLIGFKVGYMRFQEVFFSWLGAVCKKHRRKGVARRLIEHQHNLCVERGYSEIQAESAGTNRAMLILNLQQGFDVVGVHLGHEDVLTVQLRKRFL